MVTMATLIDVFHIFSRTYYSLPKLARRGPRVTYSITLDDSMRAYHGSPDGYPRNDLCSSVPSTAYTIDRRSTARTLMASEIMKTSLCICQQQKTKKPTCCKTDKETHKKNAPHRAESTSPQPRPPPPPPPTLSRFQVGSLWQSCKKNTKLFEASAPSKATLSPAMVDYCP